MDWLHQIFFETTDPTTGYRRLAHVDVMACVALHAILYTALYALICLFFRASLNKSIYYVFGGLIVFRYFGYIGRLCRVKSLAKIIGSNENAMNQFRASYYVWYFLG